ncbi:MAG: PIN domain-containing protein [Candidatus Eremiobacteraeota bacterium]|nr:PIN domain-containing protein [Candidatus Eremiobacteraeota bacterium]
MSARSGRQFVDTNILVYAHDLSAGRKHIKAKELVSSLWEEGSGCLSIQILQEFFVTVTQKVKRPLSDDSAMLILSALARWKVHAPDTEDVLEAIKIRGRYQLAFWDAMVLQSAEKSGCHILWTEDLSHGQTYGNVKALSPFR